MEKYTKFLDWKNKYCQNDYTIQIQWDLYQITNSIFHKLEQKI